MRKLNAGLIIVVAFALAAPYHTASAGGRTKSASMNNIGAQGANKSAKHSSCARESGGTCLPGPPPGGPIPMPYPTHR
jgi:hypothetical protein